MKTANIYNRILVGCCVAVALAWLWGCGDGRSERLRAIDAIMEDDPALALAQLDSVDAATLSDADYPYYCLLYTQAQVKNNIVLDDDSLIRVAYGAYANSSDDDLRRRANFYNAKVAYYAKDYRTAMRDILPAYEIAKEQNDPYWTAKAAEIIGDIYYDAYNYSQAEIYTRLVAEKYLAAGLISSHRYALSDLATTILNEGKVQEAASLLDSLYRIVITEQPTDSSLYNYIMEPMEAIYFRAGRYEELSKRLNNKTSLDTSTDLFIDNSILKSYLANLKNDESGAKKILATAYTASDDDKQRIRVMYAQYRQMLSSHNYVGAALLSDTLLHMQSRFAEDAISESVAKLQRDYYSEVAIDEKHKSEITFVLLIAITVLTFLVIIILLILHRQRMRNKNAEIENILDSLAHYKETAIDAETENQRLEQEVTQQSKELESLFKDQWNTLNALCHQYFEKWEIDAVRESILTEMRKEIDIQAKPETLARLESSVNKYMDNFMELFRSECPGLPESDYTFVLLICAGMSVRAVCLITKTKRPQYYQKRTRLTRRIQAGDALHKDMFIRKIYGKE